MGRGAAAAGAAARPSSSSRDGAYNELKGYTENTVRFWGKVAYDNYRLIKAGGTLGIAVAAKVLKSEDSKKTKSESGEASSDKKQTNEKGDKGVVYEVPEDATESGEPYIGRTKQGDPSKRGGKNDGRDRKKAKVIDEYDPKNAEEGAFKEQKAINERGGIDKLDNKRNEMNPERFNKAKTKYER